MEFGVSGDFGLYRRWYEHWVRDRDDSSLVLLPDEVAALGVWPEIQSVFERDFPAAVAEVGLFRLEFDKEHGKYKHAVGELEKGSKLLEFYKAALDRLTKLYLGSLSDMLTDVYREVYGVDSKSVLLVMEDFRGKKVIRLNVVNKVNGKDYVEGMDIQGGSSHIVLGLIVGIYFLLTTGSPRIMFIDEGFSALHDDVLRRLLAILRRFVEDLGFTFVVVDHAAYRFRGFVDSVYTIDGGLYRKIEDTDAIMRV
jgi:hypothetical protein